MLPPVDWWLLGVLFPVLVGIEEVLEADTSGAWMVLSDHLLQIVSIQMSINFRCGN